MNKLTKLTATILSVASVGLVQSAIAERWDMPMAYADSNYHTQLGKDFAEAVRVATDGDIDIVVHGGGSLFKGNEIKRAVQTGQAPIGERILSAHQNENILFGTDSVPFLATNFEANDALWAAARPEIEKALLEQNLVLLYSVPWPPQGFYFKKEVNSVADAAGIKFRTYNTAGQRMTELMGMVPVQIEAAEMIQAFATGTAEGFISSGSTGYDRKVWEHLSHHYIVNAWQPRNYVFVNKDAYDDLSEDNQNILKALGRLAEKAGIQEAKYLTNWYFDQLRANGMQVLMPTAQFRGELEGIGAQMREEWLAEAGSAGQAIISAYEAAR